MKKGTKIRNLDADILHYPYKSISHHLAKMNQFSSSAANQIRNRSKGYLILKLIIDPPFHFFKNYILHLRFMDGIHGFILCGFTAYARFCKYAKALIMKVNQSEKF